MYMMKKLGPAAAVASMLVLVAMVAAGPASAANWDPANTTLTAHGTLTFEGVTTGASATCTFHASVRTAGNDAAGTVIGGHPFGPTFSSCTTNIPSVVVSVAATSSTAGAWTFTAASTTNVGVTNENFTITVRNTFAVACTVSAMNVTYGGSTWNNATSTFTHNAGTFPVSESGLGCPADTAMRITGSIVIPGASIT